ncbi:MAG: GTP pyrophosphokinase [Deltaproteobacteria bacterium CG11_big_fil_rev_8_21_14_0_20_47_16]|nr:MAG: GTP pyrophosphokinase [Deltaproteobacteria bacterium CG11_big_fil_rev_8_21_14_0_20_47_16]
MIRLNDILDQVSQYNPEADLDLIKKAYVFSAKAHQGQTRRSGEPYLVHPVAVASILADMKMDISSIVAAILHDTVEDTVATLEEIEQLFGAEVRKLVDGVTKLGKIKFSSNVEKQAENFRKMVLAMAQDIRVILIKLADRLHNMRTLEFMTEEKQVEISKETQEIYAPIANRLGIQEMKVELEDLAFKYLNPEMYKGIASQIEKRKAELQSYIDEVKDLVSKKLQEHHLPGEVSGRLKHYYSIHRKMEHQNITLDEVHDIIAFRIIVDDLSQCYAILGLIHSLWRPIPGRFKDYIAMPKANNYQSLHTTVVASKGERVEFQIRTREMDEIAERGIAAHWKYKEKGAIESKDETKFKWIRQLLEWQRDLNEPAEFMDTVKLDLFTDDIYVFTPNGELRELPQGGTPVDFAYDIHTDVGHSCVGARVNGRIVPLRYQLHSGDAVEIMTQKNGRPNKDWLKFVVTSRAKAKIRQYIRQEERDTACTIGRQLLEKECERYGVSISKLLKSTEVSQYMQEINTKDIDGIYVAIGYGKMMPLDLISRFLPKEAVEAVEKKEAKEHVPTTIGRFVSKIRGKSSRGLVKVNGISDVLITFGKCCNAVPGDAIVGFVTRGRGISVHTIDCPKILASDSARTVPLEWDTSSGLTRNARIKVICVDRPGLLSSMSEAITDQGVNIKEASARAMDDKKAINIFEVEVRDTAQLRHVMNALEKIKGVIQVERVRS